MKNMKILIIGGTRFVGRHFVERALKEGHQITLFNRGKSNPDLFPDVERFSGNRDTELHNLPIAGRGWDFILDTCGYVPRIVRKSCEYLKGSVGRYIFVSTISVYADFSKSGINEDSPLGATIEPEAETVTNENYGPLKVLCEKAVAETYGDNSLIIRPGLIVGPHDPTDRFTYWPVRIARGGDVLAPCPRNTPQQFIDGRDLAEFTLSMMIRKRSGIYNTTGPEHPLTGEEFLDTCNAVTGGKTNIVWAEEKFMEENKIDLPGYLPADWFGINQVDCSRAIKEGLRFRPLEEIIKDTLAWHAARSTDYELKVGPKPEIEAGLLEKWYEEHEKES